MTRRPGLRPRLAPQPYDPPGPAKGTGPRRSQGRPVTYRVCKAFEIESGHMLSKHPDRCRYPHGHSRRVEVVVSAPDLDENDMVCDFKALRIALEAFLDRFDHALAVNSADPDLDRLTGRLGERLVVFQDEDPTTEVIAKHIYDHLRGLIDAGADLTDAKGNIYHLPKRLRIDRVRVGETSTSWAEYGPSL